MEREQIPEHRDKAAEEVQRKETEHLFLSAIRNLAISDDSLTEQEQKEILKATSQVQNNSDEATKVGEELCGMAKEVPNLIKDYKFAQDFVDGVLDEAHKDKVDKEALMEKTSKFYQDVKPQVAERGPSKAIVMVLIMGGYAVIRRYLRHYINENALTFIENIAPLLYDALLESGILDWIMHNGGWGKLKSIRIKPEWVFPIALGAGIIGAAIYHIMHV